MRLALRIGEEAQAELADAASWYEEHRRGLGQEFVDAVDTAARAIEDNPAIGSPAPAVADANIRRVFVRRFPYHLVDIELPDRLQVLAVAHDRRRPGYWMTRQVT